MKLENLKVGKTYKNMKELCEVLEIKYPTSQTRKDNVIKEVKNHFTIRLSGRKIKILDKIKMGYIKEEKKKDKKYDKLMEKLILDLVIQESSNSVNLSRSALLYYLNMINVNYNYGKNKMPKLSAFTNSDIVNVKEFFDSTYNLFKRKLEKALDSLQNQSLIHWSNTICVCELKPYNLKIDKKIIVDEYGDEEYEYFGKVDLSKNFRVATNDEVEIILNTEKRTIEQMGLKDKRDVVSQGKWDVFKKMVNDELTSRIKVEFYYDSYDIVINKVFVKKAWDYLEDLYMDKNQLEELKQTMNKKVIEDIKNKAKIRQSNAFKKLEVEDMMAMKTDVLEKILRRTDDDYLRDFKRLCKKVISEKEDNFRKELRKMEKEKVHQGENKYINKNKKKGKYSDMLKSMDILDDIEDEDLNI